LPLTKSLGRRRYLEVRLPHLALSLTFVLVLISASSAEAKWRAPCRPDVPQGAKCLWWKATVKAVDDGDTLKVKLKHVRRIDVRVTGIQAMELSRYSHTRSERRGACHALEAQLFVEGLLRGGHKHVRLAAQHKSSRSGRRIRRSVWIKHGGHWRDLAAMELEAGHSLWLPNDAETAHNRQYAKLADAAIKAQRNLYDPQACGIGPDEDLPVSLRINWDANGNDDRILNGEYVDIRNHGDRPLSLAGWFFRDSALRYKRGVPGYPFPPSATIPAGGSVRLRVGCGENSSKQFFWCLTESVFENVRHRKGSGDGGYLFDGQGDLRASRLYPCMTGCHDPLKGPLALTVKPRGKERITIHNRGTTDLDLGDHILKLRFRALPEKYIFGRPFPLGAVLGAGQSFTYRPKRKHSIPDHGGVVEIRSDDNVLTACADWGFGNCSGPPKPRPQRKT
jgi:endonuclease YncB( thermonuclease family)